MLCNLSKEEITACERGFSPSLALWRMAHALQPHAFAGLEAHDCVDDIMLLASAMDQLSLVDVGDSPEVKMENDDVAGIPRARGASLVMSRRCMLGLYAMSCLQARDALPQWVVVAMVLDELWYAAAAAGVFTMVKEEQSGGKAYGQFFDSQDPIDAGIEASDAMAASIVGPTASAAPKTADAQPSLPSLPSIGQSAKTEAGKKPDLFPGMDFLGGFSGYMVIGAPQSAEEAFLYEVAVSGTNVVVVEDIIQIARSAGGLRDVLQDGIEGVDAGTSEDIGPGGCVRVGSGLDGGGLLSMGVGPLNQKQCQCAIVRCGRCRCQHGRCRFEWSSW